MGKMTTEKMEDPTKGIKAMSCALSATPSRPLLHAKRDKVGPNGQKIGTITTGPREVDSIATRAWKAIYYGNQDDLVQSVRDFKEKYATYMYSGPTYHLKPITGMEFMANLHTCEDDHRRSG